MLGYNPVTKLTTSHICRMAVHAARTSVPLPLHLNLEHPNMTRSAGARDDPHICTRGCEAHLMQVEV